MRPSSLTPIVPIGGAGARPGVQAGYLRPDSSGFLAGIAPALRSQNYDVRRAYRRAAAYATEAAQNSGWIAGAIDQALTDTIGTGLRLSAKPNSEVLGWSKAQAKDFADRAEILWNQYANNAFECDAAGMQTIHQMADTGGRYHYAFGEYLALSDLIDRPGSIAFNKVKLLSPLHLTMETDAARNLEQGVFKDRNGMPTAYRMRKVIDGAFSLETMDIAARDNDGRPQVLHIFSGVSGQTRGITPLAPVLKRSQQYDQLSDATLTASLLQTIFAATLQSSGLSDDAFKSLLTETDQVRGGKSLKPAPSDVSMGDYLKAQLQWYDNFKIDLGAAGRIAQPFPGQELKFLSNEHPNDNYLDFTRNLLREIARMIGVTYESLSLDYEGATYSSIRMAIATIWPLVLRRRAWVIAPFYAGVYRAFLDEMIYRKMLPFPGGYAAFRKNRAAACGSAWAGPARPVEDELKAARAQTERIQNGTSSIGIEAAERGIETEDIARSRANDKATFEENGLPDPYLVAAALETGDTVAIAEIEENANNG